jgi:hypothetical protein
VEALARATGMSRSAFAARFLARSANRPRPTCDTGAWSSPKRGCGPATQASRSWRNRSATRPIARSPLLITARSAIRLDALGGEHFRQSSACRSSGTRR